jgi:hypothetical protein
MEVELGGSEVSESDEYLSAGSGMEIHVERPAKRSLEQEQHNEPVRPTFTFMCMLAYMDKLQLRQFIEIDKSLKLRIQARETRSYFIEKGKEQRQTIQVC